MIRKLPRIVRFIERDGKTEFRGKVIDERYVDEEYPWGDFRKLVQVIKKDTGGDKFVRFYYYKKDHGAPKKDFMPGAQMTLILPIEKAEELLIKW